MCHNVSDENALELLICVYDKFRLVLIIFSSKFKNGIVVKSEEKKKQHETTTPFLFRLAHKCT